MRVQIQTQIQMALYTERAQEIQDRSRPRSRLEDRNITAWIQIQIIQQDGDKAALSIPHTPYLNLRPRLG